MLPTLNVTGDVVLAEHVSHRLGKVGLGDLVLVRSPGDPKKTVTKRVVGMEGDKVSFFVNPMSSDRCRTAVVIMPLICYFRFIAFLLSIYMDGVEALTHIFLNI